VAADQDVIGIRPETLGCFERNRSPREPCGTRVVTLRVRRRQRAKALFANGVERILR
jgi:hypothetical protein